MDGQDDRVGRTERKTHRIVNTEEVAYSASGTMRQEEDDHEKKEKEDEEEKEEEEEENKLYVCVT